MARRRNLATAVARGAKLMDRIAPNWATNIRIEAVKKVDCTGFGRVLAPLLPDPTQTNTVGFYRRAAELDPRSRRLKGCTDEIDGAFYGLYVDCPLNMTDAACDAEGAKHIKLWLGEIRNRRPQRGGGTRQKATTRRRVGAKKR